MYGADEAGLDPRPQAAGVLRRALALSSVAARAGLEARADEAEARGLHPRMLDWLRDTGLERDLEPAELELVATPLGALDPAAALDAGWRAEGAYVMAWALGRHEALPHDRLVDPHDVAWPLGFLDADALAREGGAELRGEREIDTFLARQLAVHWRLREYAQRPGPMDFASVVANGGWARLDIDDAALADGDLAIDGDSIDRAEPARIERCTSIACERHRAASWLAGSGPLYSNAGTAT